MFEINSNGGKVVYDESRNNGFHFYIGNAAEGSSVFYLADVSPIEASFPPAVIIEDPSVDDVHFSTTLILKRNFTTLTLHTKKTVIQL